MSFVPKRNTDSHGEMMLRAKSFYAIYKVENNKTGKTHTVNLDNYLTKKQKQAASTKPDIIWQFAQRLNKQFKENGQDVSEYADCKVSINGKPFKTLINPEIDIANVEWDACKHSS